jgi:cation diffusion facilitator family transporter
MRKQNAPKPDTTRSIFYALGANVAIAVAKFGGAILTGSGVLLAEGFHSLADTSNEVLLLLGRKQAREPATVKHPLGHGRATYFWSFVVTLMLFSVGGIFSMYEGTRKLMAPAALESPWMAVVIVVFAMAAEGMSLRVALTQVAKVRAGRTLRQWFRETRHSELIVVVVEDLAAIAGLSLALVALLLTIATDDPLFDACGSIAVGALLMIAATRLAIEIKSLLIGESASPRTRRAIEKFLLGRPGIAALESLLTLQQGEELLVAIRARMDKSLSGPELVVAIAETTQELRRAFPEVVWVFLEPVATAGFRATQKGRRLRPPQSRQSTP